MIMTATRQILTDQKKKKCQDIGEDFYRAGVKYIAALDERIESGLGYEKDLEVPRERLRTLETFLHRLFPDEFADTSSAAE
jgi:DNA replication initiation complex subunit (GINS family)